MSDILQKVFDHVQDSTNEWFMKAARGECQWFCPDCCIHFPDGMPDQCPHDIEKCTGYLKHVVAQK